MLNLIAFIICTIAVIVQWSNNWWLVTLNTLLAVANLFITISWFKEKRRYKKIFENSNKENQL